MSTFTVTIKATITKNIVVEAACARVAIDEAHELFSPDFDGTEEHYDQVEQVCRMEGPHTK